ncbi:MAG: hypothetical protein DRH08_06570 [Deltaproteobacteria bacterium]|nr:MAG: hypothetical protein DRH08_06570 [Deltaproteobacteria bacterium]
MNKDKQNKPIGRYPHPDSLAIIQVVLDSKKALSLEEVSEVVGFSTSKVRNGLYNAYCRGIVAKEQRGRNVYYRKATRPTKTKKEKIPIRIQFYLLTKRRCSVYV